MSIQVRWPVSVSTRDDTVSIWRVVLPRGDAGCPTVFMVSFADVLACPSCGTGRLVRWRHGHERIIRLPDRATA